MKEFPVATITTFIHIPESVSIYFVYLHVSLDNNICSHLKSIILYIIVSCGLFKEIIPEIISNFSGIIRFLCVFFNSGSCPLIFIPAIIYLYFNTNYNYLKLKIFKTKMLIVFSSLMFCSLSFLNAKSFLSVALGRSI